MRWPIRVQIFVPITIIVGAMIVSTTLWSAWNAGARALLNSEQRVEKVVQAIEQGKFPLNASILDILRKLSDVHLVVLDEQKQLKGSTLQSNLAASSEVRKDASNESYWSEQLEVIPADGSARLVVDGEAFQARKLSRLNGDSRWSVIVLASERDKRSAQWNAAWPPLVVGAFALVAAGVLTGWTAHRIGRRFTSLASQLTSRDGVDFPRVLLAPPHDELFELAEKFNLLSEQLERTQQAMQRSERIRLLSQIASGMLHQLRNSATGARLALDVHSRKCQAKASDDSLAMVKQQLQLIEQFLQSLFACTKMGRADRAVGNVSNSIQRAVQLIQPISDHLGSEMKVQIDVPAHCQCEDAQGLQTSVINLLTNAIEASAPSGKVSLFAYVANGDVHIEIVDNGPGPDAAVADSIFEPLVTTKQEGVGVGLAQVKQCLQQLGGTVSWSRRENQTCFEIAFPFPA